MALDTVASFGGVSIATLPDRRSDSFVREIDGGSFYHLSAWQRVLTRTYGFTPLCLSVDDSNRRLAGILPLFLVSSPVTGRKLVSLPFSDFTGPLARDEGVLATLLDAAIALKAQHRARYLQIRSLMPNLDAVDSRLTCDRRYVDFVLNLSPGVEAIWNNPSLAKVRGHIRKARKSGVEVKVGITDQDLKAFYRLHLGTTKRHGMPAQPFRYFQTLWSELSAACPLRLLIAEREGRTIAASLFVADGTLLHYLYNASDRDSQNLGPNDLLLWEAIAWGCEQGLRRFSFGKTSLANAGLVAFKSGWGAEAVPMHYYYYPTISGLTSSSSAEDSRKHRLITTAWRTLPAPITNRLGSLLYRHLA